MLAAMHKAVVPRALRSSRPRTHDTCAQGGGGRRLCGMAMPVVQVMLAVVVAVVVVLELVVVWVVVVVAVLGWWCSWCWWC